MCALVSAKVGVHIQIHARTCLSCLHEKIGAGLTQKEHAAWYWGTALAVDAGVRGIAAVKQWRATKERIRLKCKCEYNVCLSSQHFAVQQCFAAVHLASNQHIPSLSWTALTHHGSPYQRCSEKDIAGTNCTKQQTKGQDYSFFFF